MDFKLYFVDFFIPFYHSIVNMCLIFEIVAEYFKSNRKAAVVL